jgi:hypothetical protein
MLLRPLEETSYTESQRTRMCKSNSYCYCLSLLIFLSSGRYCFRSETAELVHTVKVSEKEVIALSHHPHKNLLGKCEITALPGDSARLTLWQLPGPMTAPSSSGNRSCC